MSTFYTNFRFQTVGEVLYDQRLAAAFQGMYLPAWRRGHVHLVELGGMRCAACGAKVVLPANM